jgi:hypothetical protein
MTYSDSTFTTEINGVPAIVFQTKWHATAERISRAWTQQHWDKLTTAGPRGLAWPPTVKLRLARADEKFAYEVEGNGSELHDDIKVVYLVDMDAPSWASR